MNDHKELQKRLAAYCGGDLEAAERQRVEQHLAACPACRAEVADLQIMLRLVRSTAEVEAPPWLTTRIMARVRELQSGKRSWLQRLFFPLQIKLPLEAIALLLVCVSGYYLTRTVETGLQQARQQQLQELPAQPAPVPMPPEVQPPAGAKKTLPQSIPTPLDAPQSAPRQEYDSVPGAPQTAASPPPSAYTPPPPLRELQNSKAETMKAAPAVEAIGRVRDAAPEKKMKSSRALERQADEALQTGNNLAAGAPGGLLTPQALVRLSINDPGMAEIRIREALLRSGGSIVDEHTAAVRRLKGRIPAGRQKELLGRLEQLGRITERPAEPPAGAQLLEMIVQW